LQNVAPAWGSLHALAVVRVVVIAFVLMSALILNLPLVNAGPAPVARHSLIMLGVYFALAVVMAMTTARHARHFLLQTTVQLATDLLSSTILVVMGGGIHSEFVVFYLIPIAGASLTLPTSAAFFTASLAVLALLGDAAWRSLDGAYQGDPRLFQTGLYGASLFGLTGLLRMLLVRIDRQAMLARERGDDLRSQLEINRLIIAQMDHGVMVLDRQGIIRTNNQMAAMMLGQSHQKNLGGQKLGDLPGTRLLAEEFQRWLHRDGELFGWHDRAFLLQTPEGTPAESSARTLRCRFVHPDADHAADFLLFLEDQKHVEDRAQQLKLAAMGRLTASIAHEIRNPLAAIANAGQLMTEVAPEGVTGRLSRIVRENAARLDRLVNDVLRVARREPPQPESFGLGDFLRNWLDEVVRDRSLDSGVIVLKQSAAADTIWFEQNHLRQVLFNLTDNALRFASGGPGSVEWRIEAGNLADPSSGDLALRILDDGNGVAAEDQQSIFEPFFSRKPNGTGLGLYMAREFCVANKAMLTYDTWLEPGATVTSHGFVIRFGAGLGPTAIGQHFQEQLHHVVVND
jgi:two-component system sensor histidine kinase PilS (NtrC family)